MSKPFPNAFHLVAAVFSLICGLILWGNLALHLAQVEEALPDLDPSSLYRGKEIFLGVVALATLLSLVMLRRFPGKALLANTPPWRILASGLLFLATLTPLFWLQSGIKGGILILLLDTGFLLNAVGLGILCVWLAQRLQAGWDKPQPLRVWQPLRGWRRLHPWLPAILFLAAALYYSRTCFASIPHIEDSIAQLLQARLFAAGQAAADPFTPKEFFYFGFMADAGRWFSQYPPGHALLLALGVLAGAPWLVNPLLGVSALLLYYMLLKELSPPTQVTEELLSPPGPPLLRGGDKDKMMIPPSPPLLRGGNKDLAIWGVWAMALSPFVLFMSAEFMNHATVLTISLAGWLALRKSENGNRWWAGAAGLAFGYCISTRPLEGAVLAAVGGVLLLGRSRITTLQGVRLAIFYALGLGLGILPYLVYNILTTGHPLQTGYMLTWGGNGFGFGEVNWGAAHTPWYGLMNSSMSLAGLNVYLWEIPLPALLGVFLWALLGGRMSRWDKAFLATMILIPAGYGLYYFHDYSFGPRYYYCLVPQLVYFSLKGIRALLGWLAETSALPVQTVRRGFILGGMLLLFLQIAVALPRRAAIYADAYWGVDDSPMREARRLGLKEAIIFIEGHPWETLQTKLHSLGLIMGDAYRLMFTITPQGLDQVLGEMGYHGEKQWGAQVDRNELEVRTLSWNRQYLAAGNPAVNPWTETGRYTYFSNGAVHLDPSHRSPHIILARDLGDHNHALLEQYPDRRAYRFAWDEQAGRFHLLPMVK